MPMAFVLMNVDAGGEETVLKKLQDVQNVKEAYSVYGVYDIVARIEAETMDKLKEIVTWRVRTET
jgi:DNA-binding Lrp family transcriptional regulator